MEKGDIIVNGLAVMVFIGTIGIFESLSDYGALENQMISFACLFIFCSVGLISQLLVYNLKTLKKIISNRRRTYYFR